MSNLSNEIVGTIVDQQRLIFKAWKKEQVMSSILETLVVGGCY